jgi:hypothetical protein
VGLYLAVFENDEEIDGVEVGSYEDFGAFRDTVTNLLERGAAGTRFPTLILHSDCDGTWSPEEAARLKEELKTIRAEFSKLPAVAFSSSWQNEVARSIGLTPVNLAESFIDIDGESLIDRLVSLAEVAEKRQQPIVFQ